MQALYMRDSYLREFDTAVKSVRDGKFVVLEHTAFYPNSGGQPHDTGTLTRLSDGKAFRVVYAGKFSGEISHEVENLPGAELKHGDKVRGRIDWDRRYRFMRSHTAAHIISAIMHDRTGALITGNQLDIEKSRIDFSCEDYDPEKIREYVKEADHRAKAGAEIRLRFITKDEAEKMEGLSKLAKGLPPDIKEIRLVEITGIDNQADGGTHVRNTGEIGTIEFLRCENKGKNNRRVYFVIK